MGKSFQMVQGTGQRMEQRLLAHMLPALTILELPSLELAAHLREAYEANEALTLDEPPAVRVGDAAASDRHQEWLASQAAPETGLRERLLAELALREEREDPALVAWARYLVDELDDAGLLGQDDDALLLGAKRAGLSAEDPEEQLSAALELLRDVAPAGVGARSSVEALLLQLDPEDADFALLVRLLSEFLEELGANKWPQVAAELGIELADLDRLLGRLGELRAGLFEADGACAPAIVPEVVVEEAADAPGHFTVAVDGAAWPAVGLDADVAALVSDPAVDADVQRYLRTKLGEARALVSAVEQRRTTLLRVARALFAHQRAFLEHGPGHLLPLRQDDLAGLIGVHRSTVSRAVAGKHAWTPWGVFPLKHFFQSAAGASETAAREDVRGVLGRIVEGEDPSHPLSDEDLCAALAERGYRVARRTVAKYRRELGIKSSYQRRRYVA